MCTDFSKQDVIMCRMGRPSPTLLMNSIMRILSRILLFSAILLLWGESVDRAQSDPPATFADKLAQAIAAGRVETNDASSWQLYSILDPGVLPPFLQPDIPQPSASLLLRHLHNSGATTTDIGLTLGRRPALFQEQWHDTPHFRVHYTLVGPDAVVNIDNNHNNTPDYVDLVAAVVEIVWREMHTHLRWPLPAPDGGLGGDMRTDIYLINLKRVYLGYTDYDPGHCGDNPHTRPPETAACSAFITMTNDLRGLPAAPTNLARVTLAHEYMHVLQFGLDSTEPSDWLWEAWAVWAEDQVFDEINDYLNLIPPLFLAPDAPLDDHPYAMALLPMWMDEHIGADVVRDSWLAAVEYDSMAAVAAALQQHHTSLGETLRSFSVALLVRYPCPDVAPFCWQDGRLFPTPTVEGDLWRGTWRSQEQGNHRLAAFGQDIIRLHPQTASELTLSSASARGLTLQVVALRRDETITVKRWQASYDDGKLTIDLPAPPANTRYFALITALAPAITVTSYELELEAQADSTPTPQQTYPLFLPLLSRP